MAVTAKDVRDLRERTGAGMMDCKKALEASGGDLEGAEDWLRKQGMKSAEKKASRSMGEGRVFATLAEDYQAGSLVEVTCETDFVARTEDFEGFLKNLGQHVLREGPANVEELMGQPFAGQTVESAVKELIGKLGENIQVANVARLAADGGRVGAYVHHDNKKGALAAVAGKGEDASFDETLRMLCMHITAAKPEPEFLNRDEVPEDAVERERAVLRETEDIKKKPAEIQDKIITGRLEKFFAERVLPEQPWILDDKQTVLKALQQNLGGEAGISGFARFQVG